MNKKIISKDIEKEMFDLYGNGFGTVRIAKKLGIGKTTVRNHLLKMRVKLRTPPKNKINTFLHKKFMRLYKKGLSIKQISKECDSAFSTVRRHLYKSEISLKGRGNPKRICNPYYYQLTPEKAYILGTIGPGDGFIECRNKEGIYRIVLEVADTDFIDYFVFCLKKVYGIEPRIEKIKKRKENERIRLKAILQSKEVYNDIVRYNCDFKEKTWTIPEAIKNSSREIISNYLQAFADSQGCVANYPSQKSIILSSKNVLGLKEIEKLLTKFGIKVGKNKNGLIITGKENLERFAEHIDFEIGRKRERLQNLIKSYKVIKNLHEDLIRLKPRIMGLRKQRLSYPKIAKLCDISVSSTWRMLK